MIMPPKLERKQQGVCMDVGSGARRLSFARGLIGLTFLAVVFNFLLWLLPPAELLTQLKHVRHVVPSWFLDFGGLQVTLEQVELYLSTSKWALTPECAVLSAGAVFGIFVLVFPSTSTAKKNALMFGVPLLLVANLIRWWSLLWSGDLVFWKTNFFYDYIGLVTFALLVALFWFIGIERSTEKQT